jgi:hypothetical protein
MVLPAELNTITVTMDFVDLAGVAGVGSVSFAPSGNPVLHALTSDVGIVPATRTVTLDGTGHGSVTIPFTNDPDVSPTFSYTVTENISGSKRTYTIDLPIGLAPGPVNLLDLAPVGVAAAGTNFLTKGQADGYYATIGSGGGGGGTGLTDNAVITRYVADGAITAVKLASGVVPSSLPPSAGSVIDASVSDTAAISLAKTADDGTGAGRLAMTTAERTKLGGLPASFVAPVVVRYSGTSWPARPTSDTSVTVFWVDYTGSAPMPSGFIVGSDVLAQDTTV